MAVAQISLGLRLMKIIDDNLLNLVSAQAKESPRLRMNYNLE